MTKNNKSTAADFSDVQAKVNEDISKFKTDMQEQFSNFQAKHDADMAALHSKFDDLVRAIEELIDLGDCVSEIKHSVVEEKPISSPVEAIKETYVGEDTIEEAIGIKQAAWPQHELEPPPIHESVDEGLIRQGIVHRSTNGSPKTWFEESTSGLKAVLSQNANDHVAHKVFDVMPKSFRAVLMDEQVLPNRIVDEYVDEPSRKIKLVAPVGATWYVGFMNHYTTHFGYILLFKNKENYVFDVGIFDLTAMEIEYPVGSLWKCKVVLSLTCTDMVFSLELGGSPCLSRTGNHNDLFYSNQGGLIEYMSITLFGESLSYNFSRRGRPPSENVRVGVVYCYFHEASGLVLLFLFKLIHRALESGVVPFSWRMLCNGSRVEEMRGLFCYTVIVDGKCDANQEPCGSEYFIYNFSITNIICYLFDPGGSYSFFIMRTTLAESIGSGKSTGIAKLENFIWHPGQCAIFVYILEDKDAFEGVGNRIISWDTTLVIWDMKKSYYVDDFIVNYSLVNKTVNEVLGKRGIDGSSYVELLTAFCSYIIENGGNEVLCDEKLQGQCAVHLISFYKNGMGNEARNEFYVMIKPFSTNGNEKQVVDGPPHESSSHEQISLDPRKCESVTPLIYDGVSFSFDPGGDFNLLRTSHLGNLEVVREHNKDILKFLIVSLKLNHHSHLKYLSVQLVIVPLWVDVTRYSVFNFDETALPTYQHYENVEDLLLVLEEIGFCTLEASFEHVSLIVKRAVKVKVIANAILVLDGCIKKGDEVTTETIMIVGDDWALKMEYGWSILQKVLSNVDAWLRGALHDDGGLKILEYLRLQILFGIQVLLGVSHFTTLRTRWLLRGRICHELNR